MSHKSPKICVFGAAFDTGNMGVSALAAGTLKCILHRFPDAEIILLNYGKSGFAFPFRAGDMQAMVRFVNMRFSKKCYLKNNIAMLILLSVILKLLPFRKLRRKLINSNPCLREIDECDIVASIAGGDSFSDIYGIGRLLYVSLPQILIVLFGKRLILLPQTIGPFNGRIAKAIARYILRHVELIYSRDYQGLKGTESLLGTLQKPDKLRFGFDVGFVVDPTPPVDPGLIGLPARRKAGSPLVGVNISGLLFRGGLNRRNMFGLKVEYDKLVYHIIDFLIKTKKADVLLIPHVFGRDGESDTPVCEKTYEALKPLYGDSLGIARGTYDQSEIKYVIGLCDFFTGARMHACIAAISQHVPAVSIAYSDKFIGVMQTVGIEASVVDPRKTSEEEILKVFNRAFDERALVRQQLERTMPQVKERALSLFEGIEGVDPGACAPTTAGRGGRVPVGA